MVTILGEGDEKPVPKVAKEHGISAQTRYGWRTHFGSLEPTDIKRLRHLEQEDSRLKQAGRRTNRAEAVDFDSTRRVFDV